MNDIHHLNADMTKRVVVDTTAMDWQPSPSPTVWRKRLHLDGPAEAGRVTSIVRYDPDSKFPEHFHPEGEEFFVLEGVFSDEHGDYPAGTYVLNPDGTSHSPYSREGCTIFVKLRQYAGTDRLQRVVNTTSAEWIERRGGETAELPLYQQDGYDGRTCLIRIAPGGSVPHHAHPWGEEVLVLDGTLEDEFGTYPRGTWIRSPLGTAHAPYSPDGCTFLLKTGSV